MRKLLILAGLLWSVDASAQFTPGQILTAAELNAQFALYAPLAGATFTGPVTVPSGSFALSSLASQTANTIVANATGSSATPTAIAIPSCSTSSSALNWTISGGASALTCNTAVNAATLGGSTFASPAPIGSTTPSSATFTTATFSGVPGVTVNNTVSGAQIQLTGNGGTTPTKYMRAFSGNYEIVNSANNTVIFRVGDTGNVSQIGSITPSTAGGIVGTTLADSANAGSVGEFITATATAVSVSNATPTNVASISLTAGDWDVWGSVIANPTGASAQQFLSSISTTSATVGSEFNNGRINFGTNVAGVTVSIPTPVVRINVSTTTTIYLVASINFSAGTFTADGVISARRRR